MSRPLLTDNESDELRKIQAHLALDKKSKAKKIEIPAEDARQLSQLIEEILTLQPIVIEGDYLTPNEASELADVSRPVLIEMLKTNALIGHRVGSHWKIQKKSLNEYLRRRDNAHRAVSAMDKDGFGLD